MADQIFRSVHQTGAEIMGLDSQLGTLTEGKLADILIVDGDVVADISLLEDRKRFIAGMQSGIVKSARGVSWNPEAAQQV